MWSLQLILAWQLSFFWDLKERWRWLCHQVDSREYRQFYFWRTRQDFAYTIFVENLQYSKDRDWYFFWSISRTKQWDIYFYSSLLLIWENMNRDWTLNCWYCRLLFLEICGTYCMRWMYLRGYRLSLYFHLCLLFWGLLLLRYWRWRELFGILLFLGFRELPGRSFRLDVILRISRILAWLFWVTIPSVLRSCWSLFCNFSLNRAFGLFLLIILLSSILGPCRLDWLLRIHRGWRGLSCWVRRYLRSRRSVLVGWFRWLWQLLLDRCRCVCWRGPWCGGRELNVGVIWVGVVEDDMFGRVGEENVEK